VVPTTTTNELVAYVRIRPSSILNAKTPIDASVRHGFSTNGTVGLYKKSTIDSICIIATTTLGARGRRIGFKIVILNLQKII
jgi:hypothetical protein